MLQIGKTLLTTVLLGLLLCSHASIRAVAGEKLSISVTNKSGDVFTNLTVAKVLGDGLLLENSTGQFKVKYSDLPEDLRDKYKAGAAAAAEKERKEMEASATAVANQKRLQSELDKQRVAKSPRDQYIAARTPSGGNLRIDVPNQGWAINILNCGFAQLQKSSSDGQFICRGLAQNGLNLSIFVESPHGRGVSNDDVSGYYWPLASRNPLIDPQSIKMERKDKFVKVTYTTAGMPNVNYYFAFNGKWIDVHISNLVNAKAPDQIFADFEAQLSYGN